MCKILPQRRAADVVFDDVRREDHAVPSTSHELSQDKIFGKIVFQSREASNRLQHSAPGRNGRADCEVHAFEQSRD